MIGIVFEDIVKEYEKDEKTEREKLNNERKAWMKCCKVNGKKD